MKRALADVLWDAANRCLPVEEYSCHAAAFATYGKRWRLANWHTGQVMQFLGSLGCDPETAGFKGIYDQDEALGTRYMWLLLAMHVAEDEGIMVEVSA